MQSLWLDQGGESSLGEDHWPTKDIHFNLADIARMFETLVHDFEESLCEVYLDLFIQSEDQRLLALEDEETIA
jgi:hypothetical protein